MPADKVKKPFVSNDERDQPAPLLQIDRGRNATKQIINCSKESNHTDQQEATGNKSLLDCNLNLLEKF